MSKPNQTRVVDPFSSYSSDNVNRLTRIVTHGEDAIEIAKACDVILDATSSTSIIITSGVIYKDDLWIKITHEYVVDFNDLSNYMIPSSGFNEPGWYYIVLRYTYKKQRPAPEAEIFILKPSQRSVYNSSSDMVFLKAVHATGSGPFQLDAVSSYDPENIQNKREFVKRYAGTEIFSPTFDPTRDVSRIVYVEEDDTFCFGHSDSWKTLDIENTVQIDTQGFDKGTLVYVSPTKNLGKAIANSLGTSADGVVCRVGESNTGKIQVSGKVSDVCVESDITVNISDLLYLSATEPGKVTNVKTTPVRQFVGRCYDVTDSTSIEMFFVRGEPFGEPNNYMYATYVSSDLDVSSWVLSEGLYYQDVSISDFVNKNVFPIIWDSTTAYQIQPTKIEFVSDDTMRIWLNQPKQTNVFVAGPTYTSGSTFIKRTVTDFFASNWNGTGPYYQDVDLTAFSESEVVLFIYDVDTNEEIIPENVQFLSTVVRIWMPDNTKHLRVVALGPSPTDGGIVTTTTLLNSWILSGSDYYQDIDISLHSSKDIIISFYDLVSNELVFPKEVEFLNDRLIRVWMPDNQHQLQVTISD